VVGLSVCRVGVAVGWGAFVTAFLGGVEDREVEDGVVVEVEEGVAFKGVQLEQVFGSGAKGGVVGFEVGDGSEFDEEGGFEVGKVGAGEGVNVVEVVQVLHDVGGGDIKRTQVERVNNVCLQIFTNRN
jgi:hypothetical protein